MSTQKNVVATGSYFADQAQLMRERVLRKQTMRMKKACCCPAVSMCLVKKDLESADHLNRFTVRFTSSFRKVPPSSFLSARHVVHTMSAMYLRCGNKTEGFPSLSNVPWHDL